MDKNLSGLQAELGQKDATVVGLDLAHKSAISLYCNQVDEAQVKYQLLSDKHEALVVSCVYVDVYSTVAIHFTILILILTPTPHTLVE